ncbi:hypothetical protein K491DRAFT_683224 [Lophiostoma macrostomum CBS 122681]|uniref:DUF7907 domain-containing protein n=1 Tax=Lophiostoma macrostomum CBS 122681 TaxID=1314788 RepID=A0A6A6SUT2_9PLEO|nr:hypothetical protein K491DRAFT_683224 [Lophiostoma macrostomum CBS 122681]
MHYTFSISLLGPLALASYITHAPNFAITADLPPESPLAVANGWNLTSYHISPCYDYAVFLNDTGRTFYANGTADDVSTHNLTILSDGGTPPWPWGTIVSAANATDDEGRRNVFIDCGIGTTGLEVERGGRDTEVAYGNGGFYVCNSTLLYGPAIALYYREAEEETPTGCEDVKLRTECLDDETEHNLQQDSWCSRDS